MKALAANVLGEIEAGRGALDRAASRFEESARLFRTINPTFSRDPLLKAAQIYLEQRRPDAALALGKRANGPGAADVRAIACIVMNNETGAEKEFAEMRAAVAPLLGEYAASHFEETDRLTAGAYAGRWPDVLARWQKLSQEDKDYLASFQGRALVETGAYQDAEKPLQIATVLSRLWAGPYVINANSLFTATLVQFYLGKVYEHEGKKMEAINAYQEFLSHFENSTAKLPQIGEARTAVKRLM
jgi:tetratricopeptide (TPR) repeat protein